MKKGLEQPIEDLKELTDSLEKLFDSKIVELNNVQLGQTERHAFMYYREKLWQIKDAIQELINQQKSNN